MAPRPFVVEWSVSRRKTRFFRSTFFLGRLRQQPSAAQETEEEFESVTHSSLFR